MKKIGIGVLLLTRYRYRHDSDSEMSPTSTSSKPNKRRSKPRERQRLTAHQPVELLVDSYWYCKCIYFTEFVTGQRPWRLVFTKEKHL